jgi:hypothetical protein
MVRIYVICLDAFPETAALKQRLQAFQRVDLVCAGAFTTATMTSMMSGKVGSEIIPGGIGCNTSYLPRFLEWRKNKSSLSDMVMKAGYEFIIHNHVPWMSTNLVGVPLTDEQKKLHYRDHHIDTKTVEVRDFGIISRKDTLIYTSTHPDMTFDTFVEWGNPQRKNTFYANEKKYFTQMKFSGVLWTDLCHFHEAVYYPKGNPYHDSSKNLHINKDDAIKDSIAWLNSFDFNQPDSVFFMYADHGYRVEPYVEPPGFITWAYWKDNRAQSRILHPVMSSCDIYPIILDILNIKTNTMIYNPDRIYYTEDGRATAKVKDKATVFTRTKLFNNMWIVVSHVMEGASIPLGYYVMTASRSNKETYDVYHLTSKRYTRVLCANPTAERKCETTPNVRIPLSYRDIVISLGVPSTLFS